MKEDRTFFVLYQVGTIPDEGTELFPDIQSIVTTHMYTQCNTQITLSYYHRAKAQAVASALIIKMPRIFKSRSCNKSVITILYIQHNTLPGKKILTLYKLSNYRQVDSSSCQSTVTLCTLISCLLLSAVLNNNLRRKRPPHYRFIYYIILSRPTASFIQHKALYNQRGDQSSGYLKCFFLQTLESQLCENLGYPQPYQTIWYFPNVQLAQKLKVTVEVFFPPALNRGLFFFFLTFAITFVITKRCFLKLKYGETTVLNCLL